MEARRQQRVRLGLAIAAGGIVFGLLGMVLSNGVFRLLTGDFVWEYVSREVVYEERDLTFLFLAVVFLIPMAFSTVGMLLPALRSRPLMSGDTPEAEE